ncbi:MAG TPA: hypothetical protein VNZ22_07540 [Bacillota bacterium]|nr:hypothetical protein [Bacillota bacterium]
MITLMLAFLACLLAYGATWHNRSARSEAEQHTLTPSHLTGHHGGAAK